MKHGKGFTYRDFYKEKAIKPMKTQEEQKEAILKNLEALALQNDFYSLEAVRLLTDVFLNESEEKRGFDMLLTVQNLVQLSESGLRLIKEIIYRIK